MLRALKHPYIIELYDIFSDESSLYLVMELLTGVCVCVAVVWVVAIILWLMHPVLGGDLFDRISAKGCYTEQKAKQVMVKLLEAIHFLHSKNVAHRYW